jgi:hypothetical protein
MNENGSRPLIGVTTSEIRHKRAISERTPQGDPPQVELALGLDYTRAIEQAGGIPVVLPPPHGRAENCSRASRTKARRRPGSVSGRHGGAHQKQARSGRHRSPQLARPVPPGRWTAHARDPAGP